MRRVITRLIFHGMAGWSVHYLSPAEAPPWPRPLTLTCCFLKAGLVFCSGEGGVAFVCLSVFIRLPLHVGLPALSVSSLQDSV